MTRSGQVADFGMTKQMEISADQSASHSPRTSSTTEAAPTAIMTSVFGTGTMALALVSLLYNSALSPLQLSTWHQSFVRHQILLAPTLLSMVPISTSTVSGAHDAMLPDVTLIVCVKDYDVRNDHHGSTLARNDTRRDFMCCGCG